jgi:hypothetical protein
MPAGLTRRLSGIRRAVRPGRLGTLVAQLFSQVMSSSGLAFKYSGEFHCFTSSNDRHRPGVSYCLLK